MSYKFMIALDMMQLEQLQPLPSCLISDMGLPWPTQIADKFNDPRIVFHGTSCISLLSAHHKNASAHSDRVEVPDSIVLQKDQFNGGSSEAVMKEVWNQVKAAEKTSYGVVVNSFEDLEAE